MVCHQVPEAVVPEAVRAPEVQAQAEAAVQAEAHIVAQAEAHIVVQVEVHTVVPAEVHQVVRAEEAPAVMVVDQSADHPVDLPAVPQAAAVARAEDLYLHQDLVRTSHQDLGQELAAAFH